MEAADNRPKHRACDGCRTRKLACSKDLDGCQRCRRYGLACEYSLQKPMGRPSKKRRMEDGLARAGPSHASQAPPLPVSSGSSSSPGTASPAAGPTPPGSEAATVSYDTYNDAMAPLLRFSNALESGSPDPDVARAQKLGSASRWTQGLLAHDDVSFDNLPDRNPAVEEITFRFLPFPSPALLLASLSGPPCSCIADNVFALGALSRLPSMHLPAIRAVRLAHYAAHSIFYCPQCSPPLYLCPTATPPLQSLQSLAILAGAVLPALGAAFKHLLHVVDVLAAGASHPLAFNTAEIGGIWPGAPAAGAGCRMLDWTGLMVQPAAWRLMVRNTLRMDVFGLADNGSQALLLEGLRRLGEKTEARATLVDRMLPGGEIPRPGAVLGGCGLMLGVGEASYAELAGAARDIIDDIAVA